MTEDETMKRVIDENVPAVGYARFAVELLTFGVDYACKSADEAGVSGVQLVSWLRRFNAKHGRGN